MFKLIFSFGIVVAYTLIPINTCIASDKVTQAYSFSTPPFVPPKIIADLSTWPSDSGDQVVSINLPDSVSSNRYYGEITVAKDNSRNPNPYVHTDEECTELLCKNYGPKSFGYRLIGKTANGLTVLMTEESGGGAGHFRSLMFVSLQKDFGLTYDEQSKSLQATRERQLVKKWGEFVLGDRYDGDVAVKGNTVRIGKDRRDPPLSGIDKTRVVRIDLTGEKP